MPVTQNRASWFISLSVWDHKLNFLKEMTFLIVVHLEICAWHIMGTQNFFVELVSPNLGTSRMSTGAVVPVDGSLMDITLGKQE